MMQHTHLNKVILWSEMQALFFAVNCTNTVSLHKGEEITWFVFINITSLSEILDALTILYFILRFQK